MNLCESIKIELNEGVKDFIKEKYKIDDSAFEKTSPDHSVCSIAKTKDGWVGFSHRAHAEFTPNKGIVFDPKWDDNGKLSEEELDKTPFIKRGFRPCKTMDDAKESASNFAIYVS